MLNIIKKYIDKLTKDDINNFGEKNNIYLNDIEINTVYKVIKNEFNELLNNSEYIFIKYQNSFTVENYNKIFNLFNEYKKRYKNYL